MNSSPAVGDFLTRPKLGFIEHVGIYLGSNTVVTNTPEKGEHRTTIEQFGAGQRIKVQPMKADPVSVAANAHRILSNPKKYNILTRNCEHTAHDILNGIAKSPMVAILAALALIGFLYFIFRR